MKHVISITILLFHLAICFSQDDEFNISRNGLIYPDSTVRQLKFIVDSLNLKFKVCDLNKVYLSKLQSKANYISLEKGKIQEAKKDMDANMPFEDFIKKYPAVEVEKELLVVRFNYKGQDDQEVIEFSSLEFGNKYEHEIRFGKDQSNYNKPLKGKWLYNFYDKSSYSTESVSAFYFTEDFIQQPLPETYAKMILYSDCMVDTSTVVFLKKAQIGGMWPRNSQSPKMEEFMSYIHTSTGMPVHTKNTAKNYWENYQQWDSLRPSRVDSINATDKKLKPLLEAAIKEAIVIGGTDDEFEEYTRLYFSPKTALQLKRNRVVVGNCSQDNSPRIHALNIAKLSAETVNWETFLRSHLDIMNDRFERVSDGSYAWGRRKTYIKELEVLDINVPDLLLGISLRIENPSNNHYYGSIGRLGRALSESNKSTEIEAKMLYMISDNKLDDYNRVLIYYLFLNYNYNLDNKQKKAGNKEKLLKAVMTLPAYLAAKIKAEKIDDEN